MHERTYTSSCPVSVPAQAVARAYSAMSGIVRIIEYTAMRACHETQCMRVQTLPCASGICTSVSQECMCVQTLLRMAHKHGSVCGHIHSHLDHVYKFTCVLLDGNCALGYSNQAKGIVLVRMCACLLHVHGVMFTRAVVRRITVELSDTHSAPDAYHCEIQRDCDAIF